MSLDYPFYEELSRRKHPAAKWWKWGDALYYLGIIPTIILIFPALLPFSGSKIWVLSLLGFFMAIFVLGAWLKGKAWQMAKWDGIDGNDTRS
jgi:hypothetical protein